MPAGAQTLAPPPAGYHYITGMGGRPQLVPDNPMQAEPSIEHPSFWEQMRGALDWVGNFGNAVMQTATFGFADEIGGALTGGIPSVLAGNGWDAGYTERRDAIRANNAQFAQENPTAALAGNVAGAAVPMLIPGLGPGAVSGNLLQRSAQTAGQAGIQTYLTSLGMGDGSLAEREQQALGPTAVASGIGAIIPGAGQLVAPVVRRLFPAGGRAASSAASRAVAAAPTVEELEAAAGRVYEQLRASGHVIPADAISDAGYRLIDAAERAGVASDSRIVNDMLRLANGRARPLWDLELMRRRASQVIRNSRDGEEQYAAGIVMDELDRLIDSTSSMPAEARALWHAARKGDLINSLIQRAQIESDRTGRPFGDIVRGYMSNTFLRSNSRTGFSQEELGAIEEFVRNGGSSVERMLMRLDPRRSFLGPAFIAAGIATGQLHMVGASVAGSLLRNRADQAALSSAQRLSEMVRTIPTTTAPRLDSGATQEQLRQYITQMLLNTANRGMVPPLMLQR